MHAFIDSRTTCIDYKNQPQKSQFLHSALQTLPILEKRLHSHNETTSRTLHCSCTPPGPPCMPTLLNRMLATQCQCMERLIYYDIDETKTLKLHRKEKT